MVSPRVEQELLLQLKNLPLGQQQQVLAFARALSVAQQGGVAGADLLGFAGTIAPEDLRIMAQAADEDCEQINLAEW